MQTKQYVLYLLMIYGTSFLFIYLVDSVYERLPFARTAYRNLLGGLLLGIAAPFIQLLIQSVNHPAIPPTLPDGRFLIIMIATVYYGIEGGAAAMMMVWAGSLFFNYPQVAFLFIHGLWLYAVGLVLLKLSVKLPYNRHVFLLMGGTLVNQIGSIPTVYIFVTAPGAAHAYFESLPFVFVALEFYTIAISFIFIQNRERQEQILNLKVSEQKLQESEEKFSTVYHASPVGICLTRLSDDKLMDVNDAFLRLFDFDREEAIGRTSSELNIWARQEERALWLTMLREQVRNKHLETQFRTKSGEIRDVLINADLIVVGGEKYILSLVDDITVRKHADEEIEESRKYLDEIINSMADPLFVKNRQHQWVLVNEALCNLMGHTREDILGKSDYDYFPKQEADVFWTKDEIVFTSGGENINEEEFTDAQGIIHTIVTKKTLYADTKGEQFIVGIIRDITNRKHAESELIQSEKRYRQLIDQAADGIFVLDADGNFLLVNAKACEMLGYAVEELLKLNTLDTYPEDLRDIGLLRIAQVQSGESIRFEHPMKRKDGTVFQAELSVSRLDGGRMQGIIHDITNRKKAEEDRMKLEAQLAQAQKMESIGTLAGGIAHDFNNILSAIIGFSELARYDILDPLRAKSELDEVLKASDRAKDLVHQILTFSRKTETVYSPLSFPPLVKESLKMLRSVIPTTIEIRQDIIGSGLIMSDPTQIHQLVMNLCINASQAMDRTGGVLTVNLKKADLDAAMIREVDISPGPYLQLTVNDTGHGMTAEVAMRIFEPYFTTKELGRGTGLGLSVVHGIVKSHGGAITCKSRQGEGTTFDVYLPELEVGVAEEQTQDWEQIPGGTERVLFVDDEPVLTKIAEEMLSKLGYDVIIKTNSLDALNFFKTEPNTIDLVITDMTMPGMTGDRLAQKIMEIRGDIPVLLCTGYSDYISEEGAKRMGIREYILKPLEMKALAITMRKILDRV